MNQEKHAPNIGFDNFHAGTITTFQPCATPEREPDFVSCSGSAYWNEGHEVVRASDHWAGHNGCDGQASCIWLFDGLVPVGEWRSGKSAYKAFRTRKAVPRLITLTERDRQAANRLSEAGGAMPWAEWAVAGSPLPFWALKARRHDRSSPQAAIRLFSDRPDITFVATAVSARIRTVLEGPGYLHFGVRMEGLRDLPEYIGI